MVNQEVVVGVRMLDDSVTSCGDGFSEHHINFGDSENLGDDIIEGFDCMFDDINDRLTISRMVSDSVIKGMVNAVEQEAAERVAVKELEVANLKELLLFHQMSVDQFVISGSTVAYEQKDTETLGSLRNLAKEKLEMLKREIDCLRGSSSGAELLRLGEILQEKTSESWIGVDKTIDTLNTTMDTIYTRLDDMLHLDKASICEWQKEQKFQGEIEAMVIQCCVRSFQEEFEEKQHGLDSQTNWLKKINEISSLRQELNVVLKSLSSPETGELHFHGCYETDNFHRKALTNHVSSSTSLWEGNSIPDQSETGVPVNWDAAHLQHMNKPDLVKHFNTAITKMKRSHESKVQEMTEEYYSLKREYLKEKGSSLPIKKDKELDMLKKKIPEVILKLDDILAENEKLPTFDNSAENISTLQDSINNLLSENRQLRDSLIDKQNELKVLSSQVSDATDKMLQHSINEVNWLKLIGNLEASAEDAHLEAFINEEVYKCVLREMAAKRKNDTEDSLLEAITMEEICKFVCKEAVSTAETSSKSNIEDSDEEPLIMQDFLGVLFRETIKDAESQFKNLTNEYLNENSVRVSFEMKALESEKLLKLEVEENERLKEEVFFLVASIEDKKKTVEELSIALTKEREQFELVSQEIHILRDQANHQQMLILESNKESDLIKGKLMETLGQMEVDRVELNKLNQRLELSAKELKEASEERNMLLMVLQEKQNDLLLVQDKEKEQVKQMEAITGVVQGLSKALADIEHRLPEDIEKLSSRWKFSNSQLSSLTQRANKLRKTVLQYKRRLERRCSDLQMAEAEVDLLGDEVDALSCLLEKIYIALDHYSPVLQHYPGIIEILKLIRSELSGETSIKQAV